MIYVLHFIRRQKLSFNKVLIKNGLQVKLINIWVNLFSFRKEFTAWKVSKYGVFPGPCFPVTGHFSRSDSQKLFIKLLKFTQNQIERARMRQI